VGEQQQMEWLTITSPGEAPLEGFLLMGASDKDSQDPNMIGMFGSGIKYSIAQLARAGRLPRIYLGLTQIEFGLGKIQVRAREHQEILYRVNGGGWKSYGSVIQMGEKDWNDLWMPVREFVSNALDEVGGNPAGIRAELTNKAPRAKSGETRIYIPWGGGGEEKSQQTLQSGLETLFLHFRPNGGNLRQQYGPIEKREPGPPRFFRRGVLIRSWQGQGDQALPSLYDYNFKDLDLDEARKASDWDIAHRVGGLLTSQPRVFADMVMKLGQREDAAAWWEGKFLNEYALTSYSSDIRAGIVAELASRLGDKGVLAATEQSARIAESRGLKAMVVPVAWAHALESMGGPTVGNVVGDMAKQGWQEAELPALALDQCQVWCRRIESWGLAAGKPRPGFIGFREQPGQAGITKGQYNPKTKTVQLNLELGGEDLEMTILEELAHHYSGQADYTRGFQEWLLRAVMRGIMGEGQRKE